MPSEQEWFYLNGEERNGPFDLASLKQLLEVGVIQSETWVAKLGDSGWITASVALTDPGLTPTETTHLPERAKVSASSLDWRMKTLIGVLLVVMLAVIIVRLQSPKNHSLDTEDAQGAELLIQAIIAFHKEDQKTLAERWLYSKEVHQRTDRVISDFNDKGLWPTVGGTNVSAQSGYDAAGPFDEELQSQLGYLIPGGYESFDTFTDSHGRPFQISLDGNSDGKIQLGGKSARARAAVWSTGQNGINEFGQGDDEMRIWK